MTTIISTTIIITMMTVIKMIILMITKVKRGAVAPSVPPLNPPPQVNPRGESI